MSIGAPWTNAYLEYQQKEQYSVMFINIENQQKEQYFVMFINQSRRIHQKFLNLRNCLESNQCINGDRWNKKPL